MQPQVSAGSVSLRVAQRGQGEPILYAHGFPLDHSMWQHQLDGCAEFSHGIAPDLRGFGQSRSNDTTVTMAQFADDLAALLDSLGIQEPVTFCGLSMGGYIAWEFFERHRARLRRLVLCDTRAVADSAEGAAQRQKLAELVLARGSDLLVAQMTPKLFSEATQHSGSVVVAAMQQVIRGTAPQAIAAALRGMAERRDFSERLGDIDVPTLVICGAHDAISPPAEMRGIAAAIPGARYVEIPDAGHMAPLENPHAVQQALRDFLETTG